MAYKTFTRSANSWSEFGKGRKTTSETGLTENEAYDRCESYNANRTTAQKRKGTMLEYTKE